LPTSTSSESILVVDDDASIRQIVRLCLADEGYAVFEAINGQDALEAVDRVKPSLILLDLRMPVMDGWEFARRYRATPGPHAPIVAFVASLNASRDCAELASAGILSKPFDIEDLLTAVRNQLPVPR
jgi:two-component system, chemotaxis family, chemotaxis protein CheY